MNPYNSAIEYWKAQLGYIAGANYSYTISRPPYTTGSNTGTVVATGASLFVEPAGPNWAQDKIPDAEFYSVCGDHSLFQSGDLIDSNADIPLVTVFSDADSQEFLAIKTDKLCTIDNIELSYENLRFDYMNSTSAGPQEFFNDLTSLNEATRRVVMYAIPNLPESMSFTDLTGGWRWSISKIDYKFSLMELFLEKPNRT